MLPNWTGNKDILHESSVESEDTRPDVLQDIFYESSSRSEDNESEASLEDIYDLRKIVVFGNFWCFHCRSYGHKPLPGMHCRLTRKPPSLGFLNAWKIAFGSEYIIKNHKRNSPKNTSNKRTFKCRSPKSVVENDE